MAKAPRHSVNVVVLMLLVKYDKVLLMRRQNTGWSDGNYDLVGGHHDGRETLRQALAREAHEEVGITINPDDATFIHLLQYVDDKEYLYGYYKVESWQGVPEIKEPQKCDDLQWFPLDSLPQNMVPVTKHVIDQYKSGEVYTEFIPTP